MKFNAFVIVLKRLSKCAEWHNIGLEWRKKGLIITKSEENNQSYTSTLMWICV